MYFLTLEDNLKLNSKLRAQKVQTSDLMNTYKGAGSSDAGRTVNDDWPLFGASGCFLVDPLDKVQHAGGVLGGVEVLPLQVVIMPNCSDCFLL